MPELFDHRDMKKRHAVLVIVDKVSVHKVPVLKDGSFVQVPRYRFDPKTYY